ncbi:FMN-binding negative transcriptional regulator [Asticcacaulis sp. ZE23SCel15]|uniref:FMN-binding negative transcriptional regulator n=1 Tax=Asticcacaulis sp. ZE23SCel15 TaxID=3059027 RepID=UPI00265FEE0F|nr:FMN-binding negative transcriptional regulator [Asticcacaulis sp. ZE23SCel15]WKL57618.1 FMN-binding negative transcriptional regulator [Asticcacaulis sp. ZE23SCel15]
MMDPKPSKYAPHGDADIVSLIEAHPFAWIVSSGEGFGATPLPLRPRLGADGRLVAFAGHFARSNAQVERLKAHPRVLILFMGPHAYVSPSWMADRTQAPTWNYMSAAFECDLSFIEDAEEIEADLNELIAAMEAGRPNGWSMAEMGERAHRLARGIIGFRADIVASNAAFKLGQDERDDVFTDILNGLTQEGEHDLTHHMRVYNPDRS